MTSVFSNGALAIGDSITHGTRAKIAALNKQAAAADQVIDLSIGSLDIPADAGIDRSVIAFIKQQPQQIHDFAPVKGFDFLLESLSLRVKRLHGVTVDPKTECLVTPGGIKGALTVLFHTLLNPGDEVIIPIPNWPHYADMLRLHGAVPVFMQPSGKLNAGATPQDLAKTITPATKAVILGDCINPTGKVYATTELTALATVIATENTARRTKDLPPIQVIYDCPYESHVLGDRPKLFSDITISLPDGTSYDMKQCTIYVTGPGKVYGMHGDRIGYIIGNTKTIAMAERVQVNTNSFASTYGQVATNTALQAPYDAIATDRARKAREGLLATAAALGKLSKLTVVVPEGGYFLFVDFGGYADFYKKLGCDNAYTFLLDRARVASIDGRHFCNDDDVMRHYVRINCGRSTELLVEACQRITAALTHE